VCRNPAKPPDPKEEAAKAAAKAEKEKKDAMANIDINNYASKFSLKLFIDILNGNSTSNKKPSCR